MRINDVNEANLFCRNCAAQFDSKDGNADCPQPSPGKPYVDCGKGGHWFEEAKSADAVRGQFGRDPFHWTDFCRLWVNLSFASRGFPLFMPGDCAECGLRDCHDPGCLQTRQGLTHPDETRCNCVEIREALGASDQSDLFGGHEPDCVCTNEIYGDCDDCISDEGLDPVLPEDETDA